MERNIKIIEGKMDEEQLELLNKVIRDSAHIVYFKKTYWEKLKQNLVYVGEEFAGICGIDLINSEWVKIGPVIVLENYRGLGVGEEMVKFAIKKYDRMNIFIHSSNPAMIKIINKFPFVRVSAFRNIPLQVSTYLLSKHIFLNLDLNLIKYHIKKRVLSRPPKAENFVLLTDKK